MEHLSTPTSRNLTLYQLFHCTGKSRGLKVTQLFPEEGNLGLVLPTSLCKWTTDMVREEGVTVLPETTVSKLGLSEEGKVTAELSDGSEVSHVSLFFFCFLLRGMVMGVVLESMLGYGVGVVLL